MSFACGISSDDMMTQLRVKCRHNQQLASWPPSMSVIIQWRKTSIQKSEMEEYHWQETQKQ
jgi:hypothetical protein